MSGCILIVLINTGIKTKYWDSPLFSRPHWLRANCDINPLLKVCLLGHFIWGARLHAVAHECLSCAARLTSDNVVCVKETLFTQSFNSLLRVHPFPRALLLICAKEPRTSETNELNFEMKRSSVDVNTLLSATSWSTQKHVERSSNKCDVNGVFMQTSNHDLDYKVKNVLFLHVKRRSWLLVSVSWRNSSRGQRFFCFIHTSLLFGFLKFYVMLFSGCFRLKGNTIYHECLSDTVWT